MPTARHSGTSLNSGEFNPDMSGRDDVTFYYSSGFVVENTIPLPGGGWIRREGLQHRQLIRGFLEAIDASTWVITAPNGGTVANLTDGDPDTVFQTAAASLDPETVIWHIDTLTPRRISVIDFDRLMVPGLGSQVRIYLQVSSDNLTWTDSAFLVTGAAPYLRRIAEKPDSDLGLGEFRYWRFVVKDTADLAGNLPSMGGVRFYTENGYSQESPVVPKFSRHVIRPASGSSFVVVLTDGNADIFRGSNAEYVASVSIPHLDAEVVRTKSSTRLDTLILYAVEQAPHRILRLGNDLAWSSDTIEFDSISEYNYADSNSGGLNEKQILTFDSMAAGNTFLFEFNGETSSKLTWPVVAADIKAAIQSLTDITEVTVTGTSPYTIEFTGADEKKPFAILVVDILSGTGTAEIEREVYGKRDFEDLWSASKGYPRHGCFYQGRHYMGGFLSAPDVLVGSRAGAVFDFRQDADPTAGSPIVVAADSDEQNTIYWVHPGRSLQIFTNAAEMYVPDEPITPDNVALKVATEHGVSETVEPVNVQGGTIFADATEESDEGAGAGAALREFLYTDAEQSYTAEAISILAGHLVNKPRSMALLRERGDKKPRMLMLVNTGADEDGEFVPPALVIIDRAQQVTGFTRLETGGKVLAFAATRDGTGFAFVRRNLSGNPWVYLEQLDDGYMSDCSVKVRGGGSSIDVSEYPFLEGQLVQVHLDGVPGGQFIVTSGLIDLGTRTYTTEAEVGLRMVPRVVLQAYGAQGNASPVMNKQRIFQVLLDILRTGNVAVGIEGGPLVEVPILNFDGDATFDPELEDILRSGQYRKRNLKGWKTQPRLVISQTEPLPWHIKRAIYDVRF